MIKTLATLRTSAAERARLASRCEEVHEARRNRDQTLGDAYPTIADFYRGRHVFMTGGSGFLGKVILEKLLWGSPDIGNIYVLLRPKRGQDVQARIEAILQLPLFERLREVHPGALQKVVAVRGDCLEAGLGLSASDRETLVQNVSVVIHSAASVRFDDPVKKAVLLNTRSSSDIVALAKEMKNLKVLVHISTAFCFTNHQPTEERVYATDYHWKDVTQYAMLPDSDSLDVLGPKFLGFQPNTYVFSKALAENVMEEASYDIPIVIIRPTIVTCAIKEPLPGWMDNLHAFPMFWGAFFKGVMRSIYSKRGPDAKLDVVPVDLVSNITIAAAWAKGTGHPLESAGGNVDVVNVSSGDIQPLSFRTMKSFVEYALDNEVVVYPGLIRCPSLYISDSKYWILFWKFFEEQLFGAALDLMLGLFHHKPMLMPLYRKVETAFSSLRYFLDRDFSFDSTNLWVINGLLHPLDRESYEGSLLGVHEDDVTVFKDQLLGVLHYALKEPKRGPSEIKRDWRRLSRLWWGEFFLHIVVGLILVRFVFLLY